MKSENVQSLFLNIWLPVLSDPMTQDMWIKTRKKKKTSGSELVKSFFSPLIAFNTYVIILKSWTLEI